MAHPQSSPRGFFAKQRVDVGKWSLTANSTAVILPNSIRVGSLASYISSDSTGIKIGARYISTNTTGNTTT